MVRLIRDEPVRAPGVHPQLVEVGQKWGEEARPIVEGPSQEVHHDVLVGGSRRRSASAPVGAR